MIKSFSSFNILKEERRNPEVNQKASAWTFLQKYIRFDDEHQHITITKRGKELTFDAADVYIHFGNQFKVGINPQSKFDTPNGIYAYNLKLVWDYYNLYQNPMSNLPWAGKEPFIWVFVWNGKEKFVQDMDKYGKETYQQDKNVLEGMYHELNSSLPWERFVIKCEEEAYSPKPISCFWNLTRMIAIKMTKKRGGRVLDQGEVEQEKLYNRQALLWNKVLRELGYVGFNDTGRGYIFDDEPMQAVFLQKDAVNVIDVIHNKYFADEGVDKDIVQFLNRKHIKIHEDYKRDVYGFFTHLKDQMQWFFDIKVFTGALKLSATTSLDIYGASQTTTISNVDLKDVSLATFNRLSIYRSKIDGTYKGSYDISECILENSTISNANIRMTNIAVASEVIFKDCVIRTSSNLIKGCTFENCTIYNNSVIKLDTHNKLINCEVH